MLNLKAPVSVVWEVTNNCNFLCPHCRAYCIHEEDNEEIENRIVSEIIKAKVLAVNISGGEPLLNSRVFNIIKKLTSNNIYVGISTNGWFYEKFRNDIVESGVKFVQVSLDGPKEVHEKFRGVKGSYDRAIRALTLAKEDGMFTQMNVTITAENLDTLEWNFYEAKKIKVDKVFYRRVVPYGKAKENDYVLPDKEKYYTKIKKLSKLSTDDLVVAIDDPILNVLLNRDVNNYLGCGAGINNVGISSDGDVYPCIFLREKIGNLMETSLMTIWNSSSILKKLRNREIQECGSCKYKFSCGGCRAFSGMFSKDSLCPLKEPCVND